jgi:ribonuclease VapC
VIVDTSALIAILRQEEGWQRLRDQLLAAPTVRMAEGTLLEALIVAERDGGVAELRALVETLGIEIVPTDEHQVNLALEGFRRFGRGRHPAGLNYGDLFAYALARYTDQSLVFVGDDFAKTDVRVTDA